MMTLLLATFELANPEPPYPPAWDSLADLWDHPIWAAAKQSGAQYVVSENTHHFPPTGQESQHSHEGIVYVTGQSFIALLTGVASMFGGTASSATALLSDQRAAEPIAVAAAPASTVAGNGADFSSSGAGAGATGSTAGPALVLIHDEMTIETKINSI